VEVVVAPVLVAVVTGVRYRLGLMSGHPRLKVPVLRQRCLLRPAAVVARSTRGLMGGPGRAVPLAGLR